MMNAANVASTIRSFGFDKVEAFVDGSLLATRHVISENGEQHDIEIDVTPLSPTSKLTSATVYRSERNAGLLDVEVLVERKPIVLFSDIVDLMVEVDGLEPSLTVEDDEIEIGQVRPFEIHDKTLATV